MEEKTLEYIAELARLELPEEEKVDMLQQLQKILVYMDLLSSIPEEALSEEEIWHGENVFREDVVIPSMDRDELMKNTKKKQDGAYQVPKVVE